MKKQTEIFLCTCSGDTFVKCFKIMKGSHSGEFSEGLLHYECCKCGERYSTIEINQSMEG